VALALVGCGDDDGPGTDAGIIGMDVGPGADGGPPAEELPPAQVGADILGSCSGGATECQLIDPATAAPADFSCLGTVTEPAAGASIAFKLEIQDFQEDNPVPDVCVKFYADNVVPPTDTCDPSTDLVSDVSGQVDVMDEADSWYAYRIFPQTGPTPATTVVGSVQYNEPSPSAAGTVASGNSVSQATINLIPTVLGFRREAGTGVLAGTITDCGDDNVYGTRIRMYDSDGTRIEEGTSGSEPHYRYFDGDDFPNSTQPWSHIDGLFVAANLPVPADNRPIFLELWGRLSADGPEQLLGCESGNLFEDTVTILNLGPLRSDGPACPNVM